MRTGRRLGDQPPDRRTKIPVKDTPIRFPLGVLGCHAFVGFQEQLVECLA